jgi:hypothetical protein
MTSKKKNGDFPGKFQGTVGIEICQGELSNLLPVKAVWMSI